MAPLFITVPWDLHFDQALAAADCQNATDITANLTQHTNYSCLAAIDMGSVYGTHSVDYATWDGASCVTCDVAGNSSDWKWVSKPGTIGYVRKVKESDRSHRAMLRYDMNGDGVVDAGDMAASMLRADKELEDAEGSLELLEARVNANGGGNDEDDDDDASDDDEVVKETTAAAAAAGTAAVDMMQTNLDQDTASSGGGSVYMLKSFNYGSGTTNWTYTRMPAHIGVPGFITDPTNQSVIYTVNAGCIAASYDTGDTWSPCWNQPPPPPAVDAAGFHKSAGDLPGGHDINVANMTEAAAEVWCKAQANCSGFTAHSAGGASTVKKIYFKKNLFRPMGSDPTWVSYVKLAAPKPGPAPPATSHVGLVGSFNDLAIKDSQHMIVSRNNDVPLRTTDGGATWTPIDSCKLVANFRTGLSYSWTAKTLVLMGAGGTQSADHPHAAFVWISKDDGETWTDETSSMLVTMGPGEANWYENDFYINSMGQGIMVKTLE